MTGEIKHFRKRFMGGFNQQDVIDYIAVLAQENDKNCAAKDKAEQNLQEYVTQIASLKRERDEAKRLASEYRSEVLEAAKKTLAEFEESFNSLSEGFEQESAGICEQLEAARSIIAILPGALKRTGERFGKLREILEQGQDTI